MTSPQQWRSLYVHNPRQSNKSVQPWLVHRFYAETITREIADISYAVQRVERHVDDQPECKQPGHAWD